MIKSVKDYAKKNGLDIEGIFDENGKLKPRAETVDNYLYIPAKNIEEFTI